MGPGSLWRKPVRFRHGLLVSRAPEPTEEDDSGPCAPDAAPTMSTVTAATTAGLATHRTHLDMVPLQCSEQLSSATMRRPSTKRPTPATPACCGPCWTPCPDSTAPGVCAVETGQTSGLVGRQAEPQETIAGQSFPIQK